MIALVTARAARSLDEDLPPLDAALRATGAEVQVVDWDDPAVDWGSFDRAVLRSTWDYTERRSEFLDWIGRASAVTTLLNPPPMVRWNTDKHYLADLAAAGVPTVPSSFLEPGEVAADGLGRFLAMYNPTEFVVKPAVGAGSRDAQRYAPTDRTAATAHAERLLAAGRSVLLQPYLDRVDQDGETALIMFAGRFSHAIRKAALLPRGAGPTRALFAAEHIMPREPSPDERQIADVVLAAIPFGVPVYARVDLLRGDDGAPRLLELELTEPSLFFAHAPGSVERFVAAITGD